MELILAYVCKQIYIKTINYKYITGLIEVFEVFEVFEEFEEFYDIQFDHLIKLFNLTFCNIDLYDKIGFKKKINNITTESRKFYKKPILSLSKKSDIDKRTNNTNYCIKKLISDITPTEKINGTRLL